VPGIYSPAPSVEVVGCYFEDSGGHAGILNLALRKCMWPMIQKSGRGLRRFIATQKLSGVPTRPFLTPLPNPAAPAPTANNPAPTYTPIKRQASRASSVIGTGPPKLPHHAPDRGRSTSVLLPPMPAPAAHSPFPPQSPPASPRTAPASPYAPYAAFCSTMLRGGYRPAATTRLHWTPVLYRLYLAAWRCGGLLCGLALASAASLKRHCLSLSGAAARLAHFNLVSLISLLTLATWPLAAMGLGTSGLFRAPGPGGRAPLASYPLKLSPSEGQLDSAGRPAGPASTMAKVLGVGSPLWRRLIHGRAGAAAAPPPPQAADGPSPPSPDWLGASSAPS
jgi:hypothetical protein